MSCDQSWWLLGRTKRLQLQFLVFFDDATVTPHFTFTRYNNLYIHTDVSETVITVCGGCSGFVVVVSVH